MIKSISLSNFRKFDKLNIETNKNLVILVGSNAVGKTTVLESIYLASTFKSHRTNDLSDLIKEGKPYAKIFINSDHKYEVILSQNKKKGLIDGIEQKKASDFVANLHTVIFSPSDLSIVSGSPSVRRHFLDIELSMLNKKYLDCLSKTKYFLKQRNELLKKDNIDLKMLEVLTNQFIESESLIIRSRLKFINLLNQKLNLIHETISNGEKLELKYISTIDLDKAKEIYKLQLKKEMFLKTTTLGFHRDDFEIYLNDHLANAYASQGQMRNIAISIKIALVMVYEQYLGKYPILLLDDVFSELDDSRQSNLVKFLLDKPQTFITTTTLDGVYSELLSKALVIKL